MNQESPDPASIIKSDIISCSRRTDIPAFLMDWIIDRIETGYVDVVNPFNRKQTLRISLKSEDVKCWVWWSKDFNQWIERYKQDDKIFKRFKSHTFQFTINSPSELEKNVLVSMEERFSQLSWLIKKFGVSTVNFRYDPIIFYRRKDSNTVRSNLNQFEYIIENISSLGVKEVIFSFATIYPKVKNRMLTRGFSPLNLPRKKKEEITQKMIKISDNYDVILKACCQPDLLKINGIEQAHCIDAKKIEKLIGEPIEKVHDKGQRKDCGCYKSKDIGGYTGIFRCKHNCAYCYASPAKR
jgi:hypothetical protein